MHFTPGLVGGHCISVDPYYFIYEARRSGYVTHLAAASRLVNAIMAEFVATSTIREMIRADLRVHHSRVCLLGLTFKENCLDMRNSKALQIAQHLLKYEVDLSIVDPWIDPAALPADLRERHIPLEEVRDMDVLVFAVQHRQFNQLTPETLADLYRKNNHLKVLVDVKGMYDRHALESLGFLYWSL